METLIFETIDSISDRNIIWSAYAAELSKCMTIKYLVHYCRIRKIVKVLQNEDSQHQFQCIGFVATFPFVLVWH